ncbi:hypothetical protein EJ110_NYTH51388 [Nymphaea thermarum]|nr:hypothetical protein EJ110_NYTH51388 [Nymphaea thermarum]
MNIGSTPVDRQSIVTQIQVKAFSEEWRNHVVTVPCLRSIFFHGNDRAGTEYLFLTSFSMALFLEFVVGRTTFRNIMPFMENSEWGGEILNKGKASHSATQMGSGRFSSQGGCGVSAFFKNLLYMDGAHNLTAPDDLTPIVSTPKCYGTKDAGDGGKRQRTHLLLRGRRHKRPLHLDPATGWIWNLYGVFINESGSNRICN